MVDAGEQGRLDSMSNQIARSAEPQQVVSRLQQNTLSTQAQPSTSGEEQSAEAYSDDARIRTVSSHLSQLEVARTSDEACSWAVASVSEAGERGPANERAVHKFESRTWSRKLSPQSERTIASKIEQLELSQLKSPQLKELVKRLKHMYTTENPKEEKSTNRRAPHPYTGFRLGESWQEIQGCSRWDGLLDPINPVLRAEIVRYGEFAQAAYDGFDRDTTSKYCGSCKYTKEELLERCGLENRGYEITQYLYATTDLNLPHFFTKSSRDDKWSKDSNWIGFVAVCTSSKEIARLGRRDIVVAWRGTITKLEWIMDIQDYLAPAGFDPRHGRKDVMVESGFLSVYKSSNDKSRYNKKSAREQVLGALRDLVEKYKDERDTKLSITVTGHSLGSALATLCGYDIAESGLNRLSETSPTVPNEWNSRKADWELASPSPNSGGCGSISASSSDHPNSGCSATSASNPGSGPAGVGSLQKESGKFFPSHRIPITVYSFAGPRVGNRAFKDRVGELGVAILRVANKHDLVTKVPGTILPKLMELAHHFISNVIPSYKHVGVKLRIDNTASPFLHDPVNPHHAHCLEGYLHVVDGFHGTKLPFKPTMRDYALVNKGGDYLKREFFIPAAWWQEAYKGLVRDSDGHWLLPARGEEIWPATPITELDEKSLQVKKDEQFREFWKNVSIAYERSTSASAVGWVDNRAVNGAATGALKDVAVNRDMNGARDAAVNDAVDGVSNRAVNDAGDGASTRAANGASNRAANDAGNRAANDAGNGASNRAANDAVNGASSRAGNGAQEGASVRAGNDAMDGASNRAANDRGHGASDRAVSEVRDGASNRTANEAGDGASNRAVCNAVEGGVTNTAVIGVQPEEPPKG